MCFEGGEGEREEEADLDLLVVIFVYFLELGIFLLLDSCSVWITDSFVFFDSAPSFISFGIFVLNYKILINNDKSFLLILKSINQIHIFYQGYSIIIFFSFNNLTNMNLQRYI